MNSQMDALKSEADALARELQETLEKAQRYEIGLLVREAEKEVLAQEQQSSGTKTSSSTATPTPEEQDTTELMEKLRAVWEIAERQRQRKELIESIVEASRKSGSGGKMADYRRLIALSCGLLPDDVEKLLPEILKDLEAGGDGNLGVC